MAPSPKEATPERLSKPLLITFVLIAMAYVLPRCWWYYSDSVAYSAIIQHGSWKEWLHPHHLLLCPLLVGCWNLTSSFGFDFTPLDVWRWIGVFSAVATLWLMTRALKASGFSDGWTILAILTISCCWYMWLFSTTPSHYALVLPWLMAIYLELQRWNTPESSRKPTILMVVALTVAVMLHQLAILVVFPILGWRWFLEHRDGQRSALIPALAMLVAPAVLLYVVGGAIAMQSLDPSTLIQWATSYGHVPRYWWWGTIPPGMEPVDHWLTLLFNSHRDLIWATPFDDLRLATYPLVCLALWSLVATVLLRNRGGAIREQLILALMWCGPFVIFHAFYSVQDGWFRLYYLFPLVWILTAPIALATNRRWQEWGSLLGILLLAFTLTNNFANGYSTWRHPQANRWRSDLYQLQNLRGWLVFDQPGFYYYNSVYPWAFTDRIIYQAELVDISDVRAGDIANPAELPKRLYLDQNLFGEVSQAEHDTLVLHLSWAMPDQRTPKDVWIPLRWLQPGFTSVSGVQPEFRYFGGVYALQEMTLEPEADIRE